LAKWISVDQGTGLQERLSRVIGEGKVSNTFSPQNNIGVGWREKREKALKEAYREKETVSLGQ